MNFSLPLKNGKTNSESQAPGSTQPGEMLPRPALRLSNATYFDPQSAIDSMTDLTIDNRSPAAADHMATLRAPFDQPAMHHLQLDTGSAIQANKARGQRFYSNLPSPQEETEDEMQFHTPPSEDPASPVEQVQPQPQPKKGRYYNNALSEEDKRALAVGEDNHNLKKWTLKDLARYHESRVELVPYGIENRDEVIAGMMYEKRRSEQYLARTEKEVRRSSGLPFIKLTSAPPVENELTYNEQTRRQASKSMVDLRSVSAPVSMLSPLSPVVAEQKPLLSPYSNHSGMHARHASTGDYFSARHNRQPSLQSRRSFLSAGYPERVRSPLATEVRPYEYSPEITFDSFLAPHASGKGEAYRGAENAKMADVTGDASSNSIKAQGSRKKRLSKMPSLPAVRKRLSKGGNSPLSA